MKSIQPPIEQALESSIRLNITFFQVFAVLWLAMIGYYAYSKDSYWLIYSIPVILVSCTYFLAQKIDKARLEILRK